MSNSGKDKLYTFDIIDDEIDRVFVTIWRVMGNGVPQMIIFEVDRTYVSRNKWHALQVVIQ